MLPEKPCALFRQSVRPFVSTLTVPLFLEVSSPMLSILSTSIKQSGC
jgi:hypothetical protein